MLGGDPRHGENNGFQVGGTQLTMDGRRFWVNRGLLGREYGGESWRRKPAGGFGYHGESLPAGVGTSCFQPRKGPLDFLPR